MANVSAGADFSRASDIEDLKKGDVIVAPKAWFGVDNEDDGEYELRDRSFQYNNFSKITDDPKLITQALQADLHLRFKNVVVLGGQELGVCETPRVSAVEGGIDPHYRETKSWETKVVPLNECGRSQDVPVILISQGDRGYKHALVDRPALAISQDGKPRVMELCC